MLAPAARRYLPFVLVRSRLFIVATAALMFLACSQSESDPQTMSPTETPAAPASTSTPRTVTSLDLPVRIAVTLPVYEDFARQAGGDHAIVFSLVPPGVDPRTYELTEEDIERIQGVRFFYGNGLGIDDHILRIIDEHRDENAYVIPFGPNVRSPTQAHVYADRAGDQAHLWLDPNLAAVYVAILADEFVIYDEVNRRYYEERFNEAREALRAFTLELATELEVIPEDRRKIVANSDAVSHIARRFEFDIVGVVHGDDGGEAGAAQAQRLTQLVTEGAVPAVFAEHGHDDAVLRDVAAGAGVEVCTLHTDVADPLLPSYEEIMRSNVAELIRCLGG